MWKKGNHLAFKKIKISATMLRFLILIAAVTDNCPGTKHLGTWVKRKHYWMHHPMNHKVLPHMCGKKD
jgi:hypothetical protein